MTRKQKLLLEQSEKRQKINELLDKEDRSADENTELETLTARMQAMEPELRAAIVAEGETETRAATEFGDDPEGRELRALIGGASVGDIFAATVEHRSTTGQTAELQAHYGLAVNRHSILTPNRRAKLTPLSDTAEVVPVVNRGDPRGFV